MFLKGFLGFFVFFERFLNGFLGFLKGFLVFFVFVLALRSFVGLLVRLII